MSELGHEIRRIIRIDPENFAIEVEFDDDVIRIVSLNHIFGQPKGLAAEILRGGMFHMCFLESGALAWPNGLELCPDSMRMWSNDTRAKPTKKRRRA